MQAMRRLYLQVGFISGTILAMLGAFIFLRMVQIDYEQALKGNTSTTIGAAFMDAIPRRLDDPSFWAVASVLPAGFWILRAANKATLLTPSLSLAWFRSRRGQFQWLLGSIVTVAIYLVSVYLTNGTFWYMKGHDRAGYAMTWVPTIQRIEGALNILVIVLAMSLTPPAYRLLEWARSFNATLPANPALHPMDYKKAVAALASIGMMPPSLVVCLLVNKWLLTQLFHIFPNIVDSWSDVLKGTGSAIMLCWPMLWITWRATPLSHIAACTMKTPLLPLYLILHLFTRVRHPHWLFQSSCIRNPRGRALWDAASKLAIAGSLLFVWYDPKP